MGRNKREAERIKVVQEAEQEEGLFGDIEELSVVDRAEDLDRLYSMTKTPLHLRAMILLNPFPIKVGSRLQGGADSVREVVITDDFGLKDTETGEVYPSLSAAARGLNQQYEAIDYRSGRQRKVFPDGWTRMFYRDPESGFAHSLDSLFFTLESWDAAGITTEDLSSHDRLYATLVSRGYEQQIADLRIKAKKSGTKSGTRKKA